MHPLKRLSYRSEVSSLAGTLGLRKVLRSCYYYWARPSGGVLVLELNGVFGRFHVRNYRELRILEAVEIGERDVLELLIQFLRPGDVLYDVGANIGIYSILLAKAAGKIIAFEPEGQSFRHLQQNLELNEVRNVHCIQKALGEESGQAQLFVRDGVTCPRLAEPPPGSEKGRVTSESVAIEKGDQLVASEGLPLPRAVKIDVEGHEHAVLQGLRHTLANPVCKLVCCEIHPHLLTLNATAESIHELLTSLGFSRILKMERERDENFFFVAHKDESAS